jgi:uncharacterized membrane-anchored protein
LAEAQLIAGDAQAAIATAEEARALVVASKQHESEWRVYLIEARANDKLGDKEKARQLASQATGILAALEQTWGSDNYNSYLTRPDIQELRRQLTVFTTG